MLIVFVVPQENQVIGVEQVSFETHSGLLWSYFGMLCPGHHTTRSVLSGTREALMFSLGL